MERDWSCGKFNGGRMVMLLLDSLKKENHRYGGGQFNGGRMVMLERWQVYGGKMVT